MRGSCKQTQLQIQNKTFWAKITVSFICLNTIVPGHVAAIYLVAPEWPMTANCSYFGCLYFTLATLAGILGICLAIYAHLLTSLYWALHINAQLQILSAYFTAIGEKLRDTDVSNIIQSDSYQIEIRNQLIMGIKQHKQLVRFVK